MLQPKPHVQSPMPGRRVAGGGVLLAGLIDPVLVEEPAVFAFDGAIARPDAAAVETWLRRDLAADLLSPLAGLDPAALKPGFAAALPAILVRARAAIGAAVPGSEAERRLRAQLGPESFARLPQVLDALRCVPFLDKAQAFGRAVNGIEDTETLATALQSMPRHDPNVTALLMMAAVGQVSLPARLILPATALAGGVTEGALQRAGFAPLLGAMLAHAQNAIPPMLQAGAFSDMDLVCRAIERFHRLVRAITANVELPHGGQWAPIVARLVKVVSDQLAPRLGAVVPDLNISMRAPRDAADGAQLLAALNGVYLLATVRDCRDSLALNAAFDETWNRSGQTLELHLKRIIEALRQAPSDTNVVARVDAGIKMAEIRFGPDYAALLIEARDAIERRAAS